VVGYEPNRQPDRPSPAVPLAVCSESDFEFELCDAELQRNYPPAYLRNRA